MNDMAKNLILWLIIAVILISVFSNFGTNQSHVEKIPYSKFLELVRSDNIKEVLVDDNQVRGTTSSNEAFLSYIPQSVDQYLVGELAQHPDIKILGKAREQQSLLMSIFISWFPILLFIGVWMYFMRQMQGGGGRGALTFGKSRARMLGEDQVKVTFADVAGVDEAKEEVKELVEFLKDPE